MAEHFPHAPYADSGGDFAIGLRPIPVAAWLEGGEPDPAARKDAVMARHADLAFAELDGSRPGQEEALRLVAAGLGRAIDVGARPPLLAAARALPDDLCLMERREGGWTLTALSLCAGTFFTAPEAIGLTLEGLHGPVPGFAGRFLSRVVRVFEGLREDLVLERRNWTVTNTDALFTPSSIPIRARLGEISPEDAAGRLFIRIERQTLRRLPQTGGALFTIRIWRQSLGEMAADPARLASFAGAWRAATDDFRSYKGLAAYDGLVNQFLRAQGESPRAP